MGRRDIGRYTLFNAVASGGTATVYLGRLRGDVGFARTVAVKRLHESLALDSHFVVMMLDEARLASRIRHPNVIPTLDVVAEGGELLLVMEYVHGLSLAELARTLRERGEPVPIDIAVAIVTDALHGLHAAHLAKGEHGEPLGIIHRDVSPQNILVGADGVARVLDFGIAKAAGRAQNTRDGQVKGKLAYMAREHVLGEALDVRADVYAAAVVLWEILAGRRLFTGEADGAILHAILHAPIAPVSSLRPEVPPAMDRVLARALARDASERFESALAFALALEALVAPAPPHVIGPWVERVGRVELARRAEDLAVIDADAESPASSVGPAADDVTRSAIAVRVEDRRAAPPEARRHASVPAGWVVGIVAGLAAVLALGLALGATARSIWQPAGEPRAAQGPPSGAGAAPALEPSLAVATTSVAPSSSVASGETVAPRPSSIASVASAATAPAKTAAPRATASPKPPARPAADRCAPPYYVDATGVKIAKPECR